MSIDPEQEIRLLAELGKRTPRIVFDVLAFTGELA
jgi:hypothetical protein